MRYLKTELILPLIILLYFFLEGVGIQRDILYTFIIITPLCISFVELASGDKKKARIPYLLVVGWVLFIISSLLSTFLSPNLQRSFEYSLYWIAIAVISLQFFQIQGNKKWDILFKGIIFLGFVFSLYAIFLKYLLPETLTFLIPQHMHQYVADPFGSHNPLGIFLVLPLALLLPAWTRKNTTKEKMIFLVLCVFLVFSYTRAAYATFALIALFFICFETFIQRRKLPKQVYMIFAGFIIISIFLSVVIAWFESGPAWYLAVHDFFVETFDMPRYKSFISARNYFGIQAIQGFMERPWFGWGADNLIYASMKYTPVIKLTTFVSETLVLDIISEHGAVGGTFFFLIIGVLFIQGFVSVKKDEGDIMKKRFFLAFTAILIMMMGNTLKRNYVYFMFFFILGKLVYQERRQITVPRHTLLVCGVLLFACVFLKLNSQVLFITGNIQLAQLVYPLNQSVYPVLIEEASHKGDLPSQQRWADRYVRLFPGDQGALIAAGNTYMDTDKLQALAYYLQAYEAAPLKDFKLVESLYFIKKDVEGADAAQAFLYAYTDLFLTTRQWAKDHNQHYISREGAIYYLCEREGLACEMVKSPR